MSSARWTSRASTWRGSPSKGLPSGVRMSQNMRPTALLSGRHGSTWKVEASGKASMSLSRVRQKPSTQLPSKPMPSSKAFSSSLGITANDFMLPSTSVNQKRTKWTSRLLMVLSTKSCSGFDDMALLLAFGRSSRCAPHRSSAAAQQATPSEYPPIISTHVSMGLTVSRSFGPSPSASANLRSNRATFSAYRELR